MFRRSIQLISVLLAALVFGGAAVLSPAAEPAGAAPAPQVPEVTADGVVVYDDNADAVLYTKNPNQRYAPASITKIMTAIVAIERGDLEEIVPISIDAGELAARTDSTTMGLYPGEQVSLRNLLYGLMLPSGNDAAIEIARHIGGSEETFVGYMNAKAAELGMAETHFMNPHGLDHDRHYTTAWDMTILGRYSTQNPEFAEIVRTRARVFYGHEGRKLYQLGNLDRLIGRDGYDGVKIGYTENALSTHVGTAVRDGRRLYVTLLRSRGRVSDAERLFDYFYAQPAPASSPGQPAEGARSALRQPTATPTRPAPTATPPPLPTVAAPSATPTKTAVAPTATATVTTVARADQPAPRALVKAAEPAAESPIGWLIGWLGAVRANLPF